MRIVAIGAGFIALVLAITIAASFTEARETVRFESIIPVHTQDGVLIRVRVIGSFVKTHQVAAERTRLVKALRSKFAEIMYADIPKKLKLLFREELETAEDRGIYIDSLSQSKVEE